METERLDFCPECGAKSSVECKCMLWHRYCPNGHEWHLCFVHNKTIMGKVDHSKPIDVCHCEDKNE